MNKTLEDIKNRRSTRMYLEDQIKTEELDKIIEAGLYAPSGFNNQPWHFTVVQNKLLLDELCEATKQELRESDNEQFRKYGENDKFHIFYNAPTVVVVSGEKNAYTTVKDCSAAMQNMLIAAESLNVGSCWIGMLGMLMESERGADYKERLEIPDGYDVIDVVILGYKKNENAKAPDRKKGAVTYL